jgi:hypothetical protein
MSKEQLPKIRTLPALEAMDEAVGRAVEMGRPVLYFSGGDSSLTGQYAAEFIASMACLHFVAGLCAKHEADLIVPIGGVKGAEVYPYAVDTVKSAYQEAGKPEAFKEEMVVDYERSVGFAMLGIYRGANPPAATFMIGPDPGTNTYCGAMSAMVGAVVIGGTARTQRIGTTTSYSDYMILCEEVHAAGAILGKDPMLLGMVISSDVLKIIAVGLCILGSLLGVAGVTIIADFLAL